VLTLGAEALFDSKCLARISLRLKRHYGMPTADISVWMGENLAPQAGTGISWPCQVWYLTERLTLLG